MKFNSKNVKLLKRLELTCPHETKPSPYRKKLKFFTTTPFITIYTICKTVKTKMPPLIGYHEDFRSERMRVIT